MSKKVISKKTEADLEILKSAGLLENFYLAGGTGLALQLNHRLSIDLDFFTKKNINTKTLIQKLKKLGRLSINQEAENTLTVRFNGTNLSFFKYEYPLLFPLKIINGIKTADIRDIGCMKISAISSRGSKKDFIDIFFICQKTITLEKLLDVFKKKYKEIDYNILHILKSLIYFEDADREPMPKMLIPVSWKEVKNFFEEKIKNLS